MRIFILLKFLSLTIVLVKNLNFKLKKSDYINITNLSPVTVVPNSISAGVDTGFNVGRCVSLTYSMQAAHLSASGAYAAALLVRNNALQKSIINVNISCFIIFLFIRVP
jgi:hypothetical protein